MAIFGKNKKEEKKDVKDVKTSTKVKEVKEVKDVKTTETKVEKTTKTSSVTKNVFTKGKKTAKKIARRGTRRQTTKTNHTNNLSRVLLRPRITEKASYANANRTYVFEVAVDATKKDIEHAVEHYYKVKPIKVNVAKIPTKKRVNRKTRRVGVSARGKKAYVFLKEGDSIEFV